MRRGRLDTVIAVLDVLRESNPIQRADIMRRANLNYRALVWYLELLEASGLIDSVPSLDHRTHERYLLTPKGLTFLGTIKQELGYLVVRL